MMYGFYMQKAIKLGIKRVNLKIKGVGPNKQVILSTSYTHSYIYAFLSVQSALKGLTLGGITVHSIQDVTPLPHNGCRPKKAVRK